jgi:hypothetical protein
MSPLVIVSSPLSGIFILFVAKPRSLGLSSSVNQNHCLDLIGSSCLPRKIAPDRYLPTPSRFNSVDRSDNRIPSKEDSP